MSVTIQCTGTDKLANARQMIDAAVTLLTTVKTEYPELTRHINSAIHELGYAANALYLQSPTFLDAQKGKPPAGMSGGRGSVESTPKSAPTPPPAPEPAPVEDMFDPQLMASVLSKMGPIRQRQMTAERWMPHTMREWCRSHGLVPPETVVEFLTVLREVIEDGAEEAMEEVKPMTTPEVISLGKERVEELAQRLGVNIEGMSWAKACSAVSKATGHTNGESHATKPKPEHKPKGTPRPKENGGLHAAQVRVLQYLRRGVSATRKQISEGAKVDNPFLTTWIGSTDEEARIANEEKRGIKSLIGLGLVEWDVEDIDGRDITVYRITPEGKKAVEGINAQ
jgi:hypothetical protein